MRPTAAVLLPRLLAAAGLALLVLGACDRGPPAGVEPAAQSAWETYLAEPTEASYQRFIAANRMAAYRHDIPDDELGVRYQVRALEVQAAHAEKGRDLALAQTVVARVDELEELFDNYEDVLPGSRERLLAARAKLLPLLE